jgi:hypothetical protein
MESKELWSLMIVFPMINIKKNGLSAGQVVVVRPEVKFGFWFWKKHGLRFTVVIKGLKRGQLERLYIL